MTTYAPAFASSSAPASPIPDPPPVIHATLPFSILGSPEKILLLLLRHLRTPPVGEHLQRTLYRLALEDCIAPALERRIFLNVDALPLRKTQPGHGGHVGDRIFVAGEIPRFLQAPVDHHVETVGL